MTPRAGHCSACGRAIWRGLTRPDTREWVPLFPDPTSLYALLDTAEGLVVGLGYCAGCAPALGSPGPTSVTRDGRPLGPSTVVRLDPAPARYDYWYSPRYGQWLKDWTRELAIDTRTAAETFAPLVAQWQTDTEAVHHG